MLALLLAGLRKDCANLFSNLAAGNAYMCVCVSLSECACVHVCVCVGVCK